MNRILVVEDEPGIALALEDSLRLEGHQVQVISEGLAASQCAREGAFDLILLDAMLPGKDGFTICRELRSAGSKTPVIFLSARTGLRPRPRSRSGRQRLRSEAVLSSRTDGEGPAPAPRPGRWPRASEAIRRRGSSRGGSAAIV